MAKDKYDNKGHRENPGDYIAMCSNSESIRSINSRKGIRKVVQGGKVRAPLRLNRALRSRNRRTTERSGGGCSWERIISFLSRHIVRANRPEKINPRPLLTFPRKSGDRAETTNRSANIARGSPVAILTRDCVRLFLRGGRGGGSCTFSRGNAISRSSSTLSFSLLYILHVSSLSSFSISLSSLRSVDPHRRCVISNIGLRACPWPRIGWRNDRAREGYSARSFIRSLVELLARLRNP